MLVLGGKRGEKIIIPEYGLVVQVLKVQGKQVQIGPAAPDDVGMHRSELWE